MGALFRVYTKICSMETMRFFRLSEATIYTRKYENFYTARFYSVSNTFDPIAVSIMNDGKIVGHVP